MVHIILLFLLLLFPYTTHTHSILAATELILGKITNHRNNPITFEINKQNKIINPGETISINCAPTGQHYPKGSYYIKENYIQSAIHFIEKNDSLLILYYKKNLYTNNTHKARVLINAFSAGVLKVVESDQKYSELIVDVIIEKQIKFSQLKAKFLPQQK